MSKSIIVFIFYTFSYYIYYLYHTVVFTLIVAFTRTFKLTHNANLESVLQIIQLNETN